MPACSSAILTNGLPQRNAMPQSQDMTPHSVTVYRHGADLSLCYPLMWNVTLEYTATHFNVMGETRPGNPSDAVMVACIGKLSRKYITNRVLNPWHVVCESITLSARPRLVVPECQAYGMIHGTLTGHIIDTVSDLVFLLSIFDTEYQA